MWSQRFRSFGRWVIEHYHQPSSRALFAAALCGSFPVLVLLSWPELDEKFCRVLFDAKMRTSVFASFLTASSLITASTTFIVQKMREDALSSDYADERLKHHIDGTTDKFLSPIVQIVALSTLTIRALVLVSGLALLVGFFQNTYVSLALLASTTAALTLMFITLNTTMDNMKDWVGRLLKAERKRSFVARTTPPTVVRKKETKKKS